MASKESTYKSSTSELTFDDKNFNKHTQRGKQMLKQSVERNGFGRSVLVDKNGRLIGGNGIVETANALGMTKTRVIETDGTELVVVKRTDVDLDSKQGREMALADNVTAAVDLEFDEEAMRDVQDEFEDLDFGEWGIELPPLDGDGAGDASSSSAEDGESDDNDGEPMPSAPHALRYVARKGDTWVLGNHHIVCGAFSDTAWDMDGKAQMLIADYTQEESISCSLRAMLDSAMDVLEEGAPVYIWHRPEESVQMTRDDMSFSTPLIWVESEARFACKDYLSKYQMCEYGWKKGTRRWYGDTKQTDVLMYDSLPLGATKYIHKPVELIERLLANSTREGDTILDPKGEVGAATLVACEKMNRCAYLSVMEAEDVDALIATYIALMDSEEGIYVWRDGVRRSYLEAPDTNE